MEQKSILDKAYLEKYLSFSSLNKIDGLESKKEILIDWVQKYESGKLANQNETSIGADFINDIFGDVLGYNYRNPNQWNLEKELKTQVDGKKPDGAIGFFSVNENISSGVHGVIELKDANTNLDKSQKRAHDKRTPVEQAFSYAPKFGKKCKWIIVSNFLEIRLYQANDEGKFESFLLKNLEDELELKRFFFFLQKEQLLSKKGPSRLERLIKKNAEDTLQINNSQSSHLLDKMYNLIKKFDGLKYVNPNIVANAAPFNNSNEYVWHYSNFSLQSTEVGIFDFFKGIKIESQKVIVSEQLKDELKSKKVTEYQSKLEFIISRLNDFCVFHIECYENLNMVESYLNKGNVIGGSLRTEMKNYADQLRKFSIDMRDIDKECNCMRCCFNRLDFSTTLKMLKSYEGTTAYYSFESAYFHYVFGTNNFKTSYLIYKKLASREKGKNEILYFLAKFNLLRLHNLVEREYTLADKSYIMEDIKSIDLDFILHELDLVDTEKRNILIEIKDENIRKNAEKKIEKIITNLGKVKKSFKKGSRGSFPNYTIQFKEPLVSFLMHYSCNYILADAFSEYKTVCEKLIKGYLISHSIDWSYHGRLKKFETYHIDIIVFDFFPTTLESLFKDYQIDKIELTDEAKKNLLEKIKNFLRSNHNGKVFFNPIENEYLAQALTSYHFKVNYNHIFYNLFFLLEKSDIEGKECKEFIPYLINFLKVDKDLFKSSLIPLSKFFSQFGHSFIEQELIEILKLIFENKNLTDIDLINSVCSSLSKFYPEFKLSDQLLVKKAILNAKEYGNEYHLMPFWHISDEINKSILEGEFFNCLDRSFDHYLYLKLLFNDVIDIDFKDYFDKYTKWVNKIKGDGSYKLWNGEPDLDDHHFINYVFVIYTFNIDLSDPRIKQLSNLCDWHEWLINLDNFDYSKFKPEWVLICSDNVVILERFRQVPEIRNKVKESLIKEFHPKLAEVFIKYLQESN